MSNYILKKRNGYIDAIKFFFAIVIAEFHLATGIFPGGRIAVEGFFMISSFLMMKNIERNNYPNDSLGRSTVRFLSNKFKLLFPFLLPSVLIAYALACLTLERDITTAFKRFPLLFFDIFPLREAGFKGDYVVGISWYLAGMFLSMAILYPLCKKFKSNFTLTVCPVLAVLLYGVLSHYYGNLAVASTYLDYQLISSGLLRSLAASAAGCVLYEAQKSISTKKVTIWGRIFFTILEIAGFVYLIYNIRENPKTSYDYILVFVIFGLLLIGLGNLSFSCIIFNAKWAKPLGTFSTLIVLNHYMLNSYLIKLFGTGYGHTDKVWYYIGGVLISCLVVWQLGNLIQLIMKNFHRLGLFKKEEKIPEQC